MLPNHPGCVSCTHLDSCTESRWNEPRHPDALPPTTPTQEISSVHTCLMCDQKTLTTWHDSSSQRRIVPSNCPRWNAEFGSAVECNECQAERLAFRRSHPRFSERALYEKALRFTSLQSDPEDEAIMALMKPSIPLTDPVLVNKAGALANQLMADLITRCQEDWSRLEENTRIAVQIESVEWVYLALQRHPDDPEAVVHEFKLQITETPHLAFGWAKLMSSERKMVQRVWCGMVNAA